MITYRLADALPKDIIKRLNHGLNKKQKRETAEKMMDAGYGKCWLAMPEVAQVVIENWRYFHNKRYQLMAYVVMPNHVHILIRMFEGITLSSIVHGWKSYTAKKILGILKDAGEPPALPIWQAEYWDRYIRNQRHLDAAVNYIHQNPVHAGLVKTPCRWPWSSSSVDIIV